jgi:hypothetical protein
MGGCMDGSKSCLKYGFAVQKVRFIALNYYLVKTSNSKFEM